MVMADLVFSLRSGAAGDRPLIEPLDDIREHKIDVFLWLTGCQRVPHPRIKLEGPVVAIC